MKQTPSSQNPQKKKQKITLQENLVNLVLPSDKSLQASWNTARNLYEKHEFYSALEILLPIVKEINSKKYCPFLNLAGFISLKLNDEEQALNFFLKSIELDDHQSDILYNTSIIYEKKSLLSQALKYINDASNIDPLDKDILFNKANILESIGFYKESLDVLKKLIQIEYTAEVLNLYGLVLHGLKEDRKAIHYYHESLKLEKNNIKVLNNISISFRKLEEIDKSNFYLKQALILAEEKNENLALTYNNCAVFEEEKGNINNALHFLKKSLSIEHNPSNKMNIGLIFLKLGDFENGWDNYEARWMIDSFRKKMIVTKKPLWNGQNCKNILVWGEQGIGDEILYSSMLKELFNKCDSIFYACLSKKLNKLFINSFPNIHILDMDNVSDDKFFDFHIPIASLGKHFRQNLDSFHNNSYLITDKNKKLVIESKLNLKSNESKKIVGISWRSNAGNKKNIDIEFFRSLITNDLNLVNIQYQITHSEEKILKKMNVLDLGYDLYNDIDNLSALIDCCDYIVTTSNINAHIAGALGKKTFLLSSQGVKQFHYWVSPTKSSLWYPSVEIINQENKNDWSNEFKYIYNQISS